MKVLACPGQGSQSEGFLISWIEQVEGFKSKLNEFSEYCSLDLVELGTVASEEKIKDTAIAQPLIVAASIAAYETALKDLEFDGVVGHSVGEFAAAAISGVISSESALRLVTIRGKAMASAAELEATSMAAILGGQVSEIEVAVQNAGLVIANYNGSQFVAAGPKTAIAELVANPPQGSRVIELKVAGAFHTSYMQPAVGKLAEAANSVATNDPQMRLWSNVDGSEVTSGKHFLDSLVSQVANPVRWDRCMESLVGVSKFIELPPAGALAGLAKRGIAGVEAIALKSPSDLEKIG